MFLIIFIGEKIYAQYTVNTTSTFHSIGLIIYFDYEPPEDCSVFLEVKDNYGIYRPAHPLCKIDNKVFAGSIFNLSPDSDYGIRVISINPSSQREITVRTRVEEFPLEPNKTIYVSPTGSDENGDGSINSPYASISQALENISPGYKISIENGIYYESLVTPISGNESEYIMIEGKEGANVVLDGSDPTFNPTSWEYIGDGIYKTYLGYSTIRAFYNGEHLYTYRSIKGLRDLVAYTNSGALVLNDSLYVRLPGDISPAGEDIKVSRYDIGISCTKDYIQVRNLEIRFFSYRGIHLDGGSNNLIENCEIHHNVTGISYKSLGFNNEANYNVIRNCEFYETPIYDWCWEACKSGDYEYGAFVVFATDTPCTGNIICNNVIHDMFDGANLYGTKYYPTYELDLYENHFYNIKDDCVETDGCGINVRIFDNLFEECLVGISVAPAGIGPTYLIRNEIVYFKSQERTPGEFWSAKSIKFNVNDDIVTRNLYVYHNTIFTSYKGENGLPLLFPGNWEDITFRNNIIYGKENAIYNDNTSNMVDFDFDNLFSEDSSCLVCWGGSRYSSLDQFQDETGKELNGINFIPSFIDPVNGNFKLRKGSQLIDKGCIIPGVNSDFIGAGPDIGAHEYGKIFENDGSGILQLNVSSNPFEYLVNISYYIENRSFVELIVYDLLGREITTLIKRAEIPGIKRVLWNREYQNSGIYFIKLKTNYGSVTKKVLYISG